MIVCLFVQPPDVGPVPADGASTGVLVKEAAGTEALGAGARNNPTGGVAARLRGGEGTEQANRNTGLEFCFMFLHFYAAPTKYSMSIIKNI